MSIRSSSRVSSDAKTQQTPGAYPSSPQLPPSQKFLSGLMRARADEYMVQRQTRIKIGAWNVAALPDTEKDLPGWFVDGCGIEPCLTHMSLGHSKSTNDDRSSAMERGILPKQDKRSSLQSNQGPLFMQQNRLDPARSLEPSTTQFDQLGHKATHLTRGDRPSGADPARLVIAGQSAAVSFEHEKSRSRTGPGLCTTQLKRTNEKATRPLETNANEGIPEQEERQPNSPTTLPTADTGYGPHGTEIDIYVLGLQEIIDISSATEALRPFTDTGPARKWKQAVAEALPAGYRCVAEQQLLGLLLLVYAAPEVHMSDVSTSGVGTGLMGYMGNKGAVSARLLLGDSTRLVFSNTHLSAGNEKSHLERRNWDAAQVRSRTKFPSIDLDNVDVVPNSEGIDDADFAFWFGDLNYRLDNLPADDVRHLLTLHSNGQYIANQTPQDISAVSAADDPASLRTTIASLLMHDQLRSQMQQATCFHDGWQEGEINFLPTYKYDVGSVNTFDSSEKRRAPSWCDRILFRSKQHLQQYRSIHQQRLDSKLRDREIEATGAVEAVTEESILFDYDPELDGDDEETFKEDDVDPPNIDNPQNIYLELYRSHQRVLSSDHKPLEAIFNIRHAEVDRSKRAQIQHQIAREQDKCENRCRSTITILIEQGLTGAKDDHNTVDFGDLAYGQHRTSAITVANTGQLDAFIGFAEPVSADSTASALSDWLSTYFDREPFLQNQNQAASHEYMLVPGEALTIHLTAKVSTLPLLWDLNENRSELSDVLILRVRDGRDHFIPVCAKWRLSCFGRSIDSMIRTLDHHQSSEVKLSLPVELFQLSKLTIEAMSQATANETFHTLRTHIGWPFQHHETPAEELGALCQEARENLIDERSCDFRGTRPLTRCEVHASVLLDFLKCMKDGIFSIVELSLLEDGLRDRKIPAEDLQAFICEVVSEQHAHKVCFGFIINMLNEMLDHMKFSNPNERTRWATAYATTMASGLFRFEARTGQKDKTLIASEKRAANVIRCLLLIRG